MIELDEILSEVAIYAPAAPEGLSIKFLREAAQELCRRGKSWRAYRTAKARARRRSSTASPDPPSPVGFNPVWI